MQVGARERFARGFERHVAHDVACLAPSPLIHGTSKDMTCLCELLITCISNARRRPGITWRPQHLGRDVEARVVVLALRAPLERPGLRRLVQQAQSDARVLSSCQAFEPWNGTTRISLLGREQEVAVHRVPCLLRGGTIGIRPETRCRKPSSHLGHGLLPCSRTATSRDGRHRAFRTLNA